MYKKLLKNKNWIVKSVLITLAFFVSNSHTHAATIGKPNNFLLQSGLVGWWTFDANEMSPNVRDRSGQGNHGNLMWQTSTTTAAGKIGQAKFFDGSDDYVNIPDPANGSLDFGANQDFSYSFWFKLTKTTNTAFVSKRAGGGAGHVFYKNSGNYLLGFYDSSSNFYGFNSNLAFVPTRDVWTQITVVFDRDANLSVYTDGVFFTSTSIAAGASVDLGNSNGFEIGQWSGAIRPYGGLIDDVRIYNRALSASEITALYNSAATKYNTSATPGSTLTQGLVGHWTFDGKDMGPNIRDRSGQGNHGNLIGQPSTTTVAGKLGQALSFDGVDDLIKLGDIQSSLNGDAMTIAAWINPAGTKVEIGHIVSFNGAQGTLKKFGTSIFLNTAGLSDTSMSADGVVFSGKWMHVVFTYNGSVKIIYINGVNVVQESVTGTLTTSSDSRIGQRAGDVENFDGSIDDVRIYNRALSASEITALYNSAATKYNTSATPGSTLTQGLVGHWTFDGKDMGPNIRDRSGQGNHGNLIGQPSTTTVAGKLGQALSFDGVDDYVEIASYTNFNFERTDPFSFAGWVYIKNSLTDQPYVIVGRYDIPVNYRGYNLDVHGLVAGYNTNSVSFDLISNASVTDQWLSAQAPVNSIKPNQWYHIVGTYNGSSVVSGMKIYINGVSQTITTTGNADSISNTTQNTKNLRIGDNYDVDNVKGYLDDVRIYNRTLTASEVLQLYNLGR